MERKNTFTAVIEVIDCFVMTPCKMDAIVPKCLCCGTF